MALLDLITEPDPRYATISDRLRQKSERIDRIDESLRALAGDMFDTMMHERGVGLAAPQVGVRKRLVVIHVPAGFEQEDDPDLSLTLINPEVMKAGGREYGIEGCLSFPDLVGEVPRYSSVNVRALNLEGKTLRIRARGNLARVLQHEIDHLDGVLYFDRMDDWTTLGYLQDRTDDATDPATAGELADVQRS
ncbi:MAG TPA: peptide deformylase [Thermomicrobiales bacterium]|nr:peptide deformylase [Thermomicrobiales bacterium]